ncbi:MAG: hypothetical protein ACJA0E_001292 [Bermanella sp.]|jgi:hypothetical protein
MQWLNNITSPYLNKGFFSKIKQRSNINCLTNKDLFHAMVR